MSEAGSGDTPGAIRDLAVSFDRMSYPIMEISLRERIMKRFKSSRQLQRFVSIHDPIANLFHVPRHDIPSAHYRELRGAAMQMWSEIAHL